MCQEDKEKIQSKRERGKGVAKMKDKGREEGRKGGREGEREGGGRD